MLSRADGIDIE